MLKTLPRLMVEVIESALAPTGMLNR